VDVQPLYALPPHGDSPVAGETRIALLVDDRLLLRRGERVRPGRREREPFRSRRGAASTSSARASGSVFDSTIEAKSSVFSPVVPARSSTRATAGTWSWLPASTSISSSSTPRE
jgi:hypothetical protein